MHAGRVDGLREEAAAVWLYLALARERPITLEISARISAAEEGGRSWLGDFPEGAVASESCARSAVVVQTSGTSGEPKSTRHDLADRLAHTHAGDPEARWLLAYAPHRWAGLSVLLHVARSRSSLVVPERLSPEAILAAGIEYGATHLSLTPSHLRRMLLSIGEAELGRLPLRQLSFGGEAATQTILDKARALWPGARVTHVYAATEFGDICAASDGIEGFSRSKFERSGFDVSGDGSLWIDGRDTGDLWELRGDRYCFAGRREEVISVGGVNVALVEVEREALMLEGVAEARAYARSNALLGHVVALDYSGELDERALRREISQRLPKPARPALVRRVESIELSEAGKTRRLEEGA